MTGIFNDADRITLDTPNDGTVATSVRAGEWEIAYPTGGQRYVGTRAEVEAQMLRRITAG
jgi:hypothetical protein